MTTENSRADALTDQAITEIYRSTYGYAPAPHEIQLVRSVERAIRAASPASQPAAAPRYEVSAGGEWFAATEAQYNAWSGKKRIAATAPSPADERAALSEQDIYDKFSFLEGLVNESTYVQIADTAIEIARAASANETGAEGIAHEVWAAAQLAPGEGIEDGTRRVAAILSRAPAQAAEPVAWVRKHPDTGELSGDWLWNDVIEQCRKASGVWFPVGFLGATPAVAAEVTAIHQVIHQVWVDETSSWADVTPAYYAERQPSNRRRVYYAPQPAQADARIDVEAMLHACVPGGDICDPQRIADSIREWFDEHGQNAAQADARVGLTDGTGWAALDAIEWCIEHGNCGPRTRARLVAVRALLQGANQ